MQPAVTMYFPTTGYYSYTTSGTYPFENSVPMEYYLPPAGIRVIAPHHQIPSSSGSDRRHNCFTRPPPMNHLPHHPQWNNALCYNGPTYYVAPTMYTSFPLPLGTNTTGNMTHVVSIPSPDLPYSTMENAPANEHVLHEGTQ